jgi:hypothetical protein
MRASGEISFLYNFKEEGPDDIHGGPFGFLVREVAFHSPSLSTHDYLGMPETIEDICHGDEDQFGESTNAGWQIDVALIR